MDIIFLLLFMLSFVGFFIFFIGLLIVLIRKKPKNKMLGGMVISFFIFFGSLVGFSFNIDDKKNVDDSAVKTETTKNATTITPTETTETTITPTSTLPTISPEDITDTDYVILWSNYSDNEYQDKYVRIIRKIDTVNSFSIIFKEGLTGISGMLQMKPNDVSVLDNYSEGETVVIVGKVTGKILDIVTLNIEDIKKATDQDIQKISWYATERQIKNEVAVKEKEEKLKNEMKEYKESAETITYENLIREPTKYEGRIIKVTIKISQLMSGGIISESGYAGKSDGNEWYVHYDIPKDVPRILEKDSVTFYGEFDGVKEMTRALTRTTDYIPKINAKYHIINN